MGTRSSRGKNGRAGKCVVNKKIRKRIMNNNEE